MKKHNKLYTYNEMGQVIKKGLGYVSPTTWLQNLDMRYNIRGQLLSINNSKLTSDTGKTSSDANDVFGMRILYDQLDANVGNTPSYNGKVSAVKWMSVNASGAKSPERSFKYSYDQVDRYTGSAYAERATTATGSFGNNIGGFDEYGITYDPNGNLLTLKRNSSSPGATTHHQIDSLTYSYSSVNGNQLTNVTDGTDSLHTDAGFRNLTGSTSGYMFDPEGNLKKDYKKGITNISYNVLNRTDTLQISATQYITYTYDAGGNLIRKQAYKSGTTTQITDYIDGFVYNNTSGTETLAYFPMPEGRVLYNASSFTQEYIITDPQGNARVSFQNVSGAAKVFQENSYYATGLIMPNSPVAAPTTPNKQLYNGGSEWQNDYSNLPDYYQTFNRNYDAAIGRFIGADPMAESAESMTPYQYAGNNPVMNNDPEGDLARTPWSVPQIIYWTPSLTLTNGALQTFENDSQDFDSSFGTATQDANNVIGDGESGSGAVNTPFNQGTLFLSLLDNAREQGFRASIGFSGIAAPNATVSGSYFYQTSSVSGNQLNIEGHNINFNGANQGGGLVNIFVVNNSSWNDVGHTAVQINNGNVMGYYPTASDGRNYSSADLMSSNGRVDVKTLDQFNIKYGSQGYMEYTLNLNSQQLSSFQNYLSNLTVNPGIYQLFTNNCTSVIIQGLENAGVPLRNPLGDPISPALTSPAVFGSELSHPFYMPGIVTGMHPYGGN